MLCTKQSSLGGHEQVMRDHKTGPANDILLHIFRQENIMHLIEELCKQPTWIRIVPTHNIHEHELWIVKNV